MTRKNIVKKRAKVSYLNIVLLGMLPVYLFMALRNSAFPFKIHLILFVVVFVLFLIAAKTRKKGIKMGVIVLIALLSFVQNYVQSLIGQVFVNQQNKYQDYLHVEVSILTSKNSSLTQKDYSNKRFGISQQIENDLFKQISNKLKEDSQTDIVIEPFSTNQTVFKKISENTLDFMIINESDRPALEKAIPGFSDQTKVVAKYSFDYPQTGAIRAGHPTKDSFMVYLSGNDVLGSIEKVSRSDVNMLLVVNPKIQRVLMVSIPRDSYVPVACANGQYDKMTHTGNFGMKCQINTIGNFIKNPINYFVRVNFSSVKNIVDALGGNISLYNPYGFVSSLNHEFKQGWITLNGDQTLEYTRERYKLPDGDTGRQEHQKIVLNALVKKALSLENIFKMDQILQTVSSSMDTNIDSALINQMLSYQLDKKPNWEFDSLVIKGDSAMKYTYSVPSSKLFVFVLDDISLRDVNQKIEKFSKAQKLEELDFIVEKPKQPDKK